MILSIWLSVDVPGKRGLPRSISPSMQPKLHMSTPLVYLQGMQKDEGIGTSITICIYGLHVYLIIQSKLLTKSPNGTISGISICKRFMFNNMLCIRFFIVFRGGVRIGLCGQIFSTPVFALIDKYP